MDPRADIAACRLCAERFAATSSAHAPRPVIWFDKGAPIRLIGQAPGMRVHETGLPFDDRSGERLRDWLGLDRTRFYNRKLLAITPMAFCFPGYNARHADLPPPPLCARTWTGPVGAYLGPARLTLLVGGYAQKWHLQTRAPVTETVANWRALAPAIFPLPHPSWRNTAWLKKNPWFADELLPVLRAQVKEVLR